MTIETSLTTTTDTTAVSATGADASTAADTTATGDQPANQQTGTEQSADPVLDAEGKPVDPPKADEGAPETYADFTAPEGVTAPAGELLTEFTTLAKELGMSQAKAQDAFALVAKLAEKGGATAAARAAAAAETARLATIEANHAAVSADPELGGEKLAENMSKARTAMQATTTPAFRELLKTSGLVNNPELIRHFLTIAPAFSESKHVAGGTAPGTQKSAAKVLYPNSN
jgi:hypothetical protein